MTGGARLALVSIALLHQACTTTPAPQLAADGAPSAGIGNEAGDAPGTLTEGGPGPTDTGLPPDAAPLDSGSPCPPSFAGCTTFVPAPGAGNATLAYRNYAYDPKCLSIKAGSTVTFAGEPDAGDFLVHPLVQACGPAPVLAFRDARTTASFVLTAPGIYGYYCLDHGNPAGMAMSGAIQVVP